MTIAEVEKVARIYVLVDPLDGEVRYVGQTVTTLQLRLRRHLSRHRGNWPSVVWIGGLKARGVVRTAMKDDPSLVNLHEERRQARRSEVLRRHALGDSRSSVMKGAGVSSTEYYRIVRGIR